MLFYYIFGFFLLFNIYFYVLHEMFNVSLLILLAAHKCLITYQSYFKMSVWH